MKREVIFYRNIKGLVQDRCIVEYDGDDKKIQFLFDEINRLRKVNFEKSTILSKTHNYMIEKMKRMSLFQFYKWKKGIKTYKGYRDRVEDTLNLRDIFNLH